MNYPNSKKLKEWKEAISTIEGPGYSKVLLRIQKMRWVRWIILSNWNSENDNENSNKNNDSCYNHNHNDYNIDDNDELMIMNTKIIIDNNNKSYSYNLGSSNDENKIDRKSNSDKNNILLETHPPL